MPIFPRSASGPSVPFLAALLLVGCGGDGATTDAERPGTDGTLGAPTAVFPEDFGSIQTVRELPDGRVLVADPLGGALYAVDMDAGTRTVVGTEGAGPQEYRQPDAVWPLPGDSTLLVDLGNGRLTALDADLSFGPTMPIVVGDPSLGDGLVLALPVGVDGAGRIYARGMGGGIASEASDSATIHRIDRSSGVVDTAAAYKLEERVRTTDVGPNGGRRAFVSQVRLSREDAWGVASDGSLAVARSADYHIDWIGPDGSATSGPPVPFESRPVTTSDKEEDLRESSRAGGLRITVSVRDGDTQMGFSRGGGGRGEPDPDDQLWAETTPPFHPGRLPIDPQNRVWVRRYVPPGEPPAYDIFSRGGELVRSVRLGEGRRVIGFGSDWVYVVRFDDFDLSYLERYALPE